MTCSVDVGDREVPGVRTHGGILEGGTGTLLHRIQFLTQVDVRAQQLRSADEGSTIFYTVRTQGREGRHVRRCGLTEHAWAVRQVQIWLASEQLERLVRSVVGLRAQREWDCYTYTPTEQKRATTPKPPRRLAADATASSRAGIFSFGRLWTGGAG